MCNILFIITGVNSYISEVVILQQYTCLITKIVFVNVHRL